MQRKTRTQQQNEWIEAQNVADQIEMLTEALNQTCDFTGWTLVETLSNIYFENKRANDLKEQELNKK